MKTRYATWAAAFLAFLNFYAPAATLYVSLASTNPAPPYADWSTASTNIQDAVDVSTNGDLILVTNAQPPFPQQTNAGGIAIFQAGGRVIYGSLMNRVAIDKAVTVESVNGSSVTFIKGTGLTGPSPVRCVYMTNGAILIGFTLTNGVAFDNSGTLQNISGGGIWSESTNDVITNCVISGCYGYYGAGVASGTLYNCKIFNNSPPNNHSIYTIYGGGAYQSQLNSCTIANNTADNGGGGGGAAYSVLNNCTIVSNSASTSGGGGGTYSSFLTNCTLVGNSATQSGANCYGGGAFGGTLDNCTLIGNSANDGGAAAGNAGAPVLLNNCIISSNTASEGGGVYVPPPYNSLSYTNCILNDCTLVSNSAASSGGGSFMAELNNCVISNNSAGALQGGSGGGIEGGLLNNCTLAGNIAGSGGGVDGGQAGPTILSNCTLVANSAGQGGGASFSCTLNNCILLQNRAWNGPGDGWGGGGATFSTLNNCMLLQNTTWTGTSGGGGASFSKLNDCLIESNSAVESVNPNVLGKGGGTYASSVTNCILTYNSAGTNGGGDYQSTLANCTVVGNSAPIGGGGYNSTFDNCIVYYNMASSGPNYSGGTFNYSCTTPLTNGLNNIINEPLFINLAGGDFHLSSNSPCINSGNNDYVTSTTDLDGNPRIVGGTVDIGAYEYQTPVSKISYAWLQQYGLPITSNIDTADLDGTAFNVYQDWIAGLNPTNVLSVLAMLPPALTNNPAGLVVSWESVSNRTYFLQSSTNLGMQSAFSTIQNNILGSPTGTNQYTDTTATNAGPYFYRVGVQQ